MASKTEICNLAISHLGVGSRIANVETERSAEAAICRTFFEITRDITLRDFDWIFSRKTVTLGLIESDPNDEWGYSYRYPSDCINARRIPSGIRNDNRQSRIPYEIAQDDDGQLIYTDKAEAQLVYTKKETNTERYPADFVMMQSLLLAAYIAPAVTGADPFKLGDRALKLYTYHKSVAEAASGNEGQAEEPPEAESIRARET